jgi:hypothetical protein
MKYLPLFLFLISLNAHANFSSLSKEEFCEDRKYKSFVKGLTQNSSNLMGFRNRGGLFKGGICWWHSRFQRNALHLTYFNPQAAKPDSKTALKLIRDIRFQNGIVEIPGFENFEQFSTVFENEIQKELERWQKFESVRFTWIRGLRGSTSVNPEFLKTLMDDLYEEVITNNNISFQKLQMKGVTAHAWLVINMIQTQEGYDLEVLDSNYPKQTTRYQYKFGDSHLMYPGYSQFVPYLEHTNEVQWLHETIKEECSQVSKF